MNIKLPQFSFNKFSFNSLLAELDKGLSQVEKIGIDYHRTRFAYYHQLITALVDSLRLDTHDEFKKRHDFESSVIALTESAELISVINNLPLESNIYLLSKLRKVFKGALLPSGENVLTTSNESRNIFFELVLGARLYQAYGNLDFSVEDLQVIDGNDKYVIECKRPFSNRSIFANFHKAIKQLNEKTINDINCYGLIAMSINRVLTDGELFLSARDENALSARMKYETDKFIREWMEIFYKNVINPRVLGIIVHLSVPGILEEKKLIYNTQFFTTTNFCIADSSDYNKLAKFIAKMGPLKGNI